MYDDIRALTNYHCYGSFAALMRSMLDALRDGPGPHPDPAQITS